MALWAAWPSGQPVTAALLLAAIVQGVRLARWCGHRTLVEPFVWILHLAYAWLPLGVAALAVAGWTDAVPVSMGIHALTVGAIGTITLAVMTRATLGHTGRPLHADRATTAIYLAVTIAALARLAAGRLPDQLLPLLALSGTGWVLAFGGFVVVYGRYLTKQHK